MKAQYIGTQQRINQDPLILVNVEYHWGINTEVYDPEIHELSEEDLEQINQGRKL